MSWRSTCQVVSRIFADNLSSISPVYSVLRGKCCWSGRGRQQNWDWDRCLWCRSILASPVRKSHTHLVRQSQWLICAPALQSASVAFSCSFWCVALDLTWTVLWDTRTRTRTHSHTQNLGVTVFPFNPPADEREDVQKKTFTKWVNSQLTKVRAFPYFFIMTHCTFTDGELILC